MKNIKSVSERQSGRALLALFLFLFLAIASCVKCFGQNGPVAAAGAGYYAGVSQNPGYYTVTMPASDFGEYETQVPAPSDTTIELRGAFLQGDTCVVSFRTTLATFSGGNLAYIMLPAIQGGQRPVMNFETLRGECLSDNCDLFFYDTDKGRVTVRIEKGGYFISVANQHFSLNLFPITIESYTIIK